MTSDGDLNIDLHPEHPQIVFASPCSSHGFKFAPVVGQMLADLAVNGATPYPDRSLQPRPASAERVVESDEGGSCGS